MSIRQTYFKFFKELDNNINTINDDVFKKLVYLFIEFFKFNQKEIIDIDCAIANPLICLLSNGIQSENGYNNFKYLIEQITLVSDTYNIKYVQVITHIFSGDVKTLYYYTPRQVFYHSSEFIVEYRENQNIGLCQHTNERNRSYMYLLSKNRNIYKQYDYDDIQKV